MKTYRILALLTVSAVAVSCHFLDFDETDGLYTHEDIYKYFDNTKQMLTNVYSYIPQDFGAIDGAMRDNACDDAECGNAGCDVQDFNNGNWSSLSTHDTAWSLYDGIRAANGFIASIADVDFSRFEHSTGYENMEKQLRYFPYEARVLRAFYFFELARRYGDIAMPTRVLSIAEANTIGKTAFHDVIAFIVAECDECASDGNLPDTYAGQPGNETGRVTRGFALALKSKALLYAASELHNPSMDEDRWKVSAGAALDLIESGLYSLDPEDKCNNVSSPEIVLMRMNNDDYNFELRNFPVRFIEGRRSGVVSGTFPTQNLVDAFQTKNGYTVTLGETGWECDDPQFNVLTPYRNRDPRFARTILANGSSFKGSTIAVYDGGQDDAAIAEGGSPTGYFLRKYIQESTVLNPNNSVTNKHHWIVYRYAETLLTYAESMIGAFGDPDYSDATYKHSARWALNQVRSNAGMPDVTVSGKDAFIDALRNEWRVEFAFEDHRFWDVRRWKIGDATQRRINGVTITRNGSGYNYRRTLCESRTWNDRMYLYPIPQSELYKNGNLNPQNVGW